MDIGGHHVTQVNSAYTVCPVAETFGDYISKFSQIWKIAKWIIQIDKFIYDKIN